METAGVTLKIKTTRNALPWIPERLMTSHTSVVTVAKPITGVMHVDMECLLRVFYVTQKVIKRNSVNYIVERVAKKEAKLQ